MVNWCRVRPETAPADTLGPVTQPRLLVIMGSGETAPTMTKPHRMIFERLDPPVDAVMLDTPFGFQENADDLVEKSLEYFAKSVGHRVEAAGLRRSDGDDLAVETALARIRTADWLFAGPGSPTYALRQWKDTPVPAAISEMLATGGAVVFSSAAALTIGLRTVPVYEVYKVGMEPFWLEGLDLLSALGLPVSVIPHYDNNEGGNHDTRMCYLGEKRLSMIEGDLPDGSFILGVDEHTGVVFDLDADTAEIFGKGVLTLRKEGESVTIPAGVTVDIDVLRAAGRDGLMAGSAGTNRGSAHTAPQTAVGDTAPGDTAPGDTAVDDTAVGATLLDEVRAAEAAFDHALDARDADAAVAAVLSIDDAVDRWSKDTTQTDHVDRARAARRTMIVRLGAAAKGGVRDPRDIVGPVVGAVLELRRVVRDEKRYDLSDVIRDELALADVEVRDTADGVEWVLGDRWQS